MKKRYYNIEKRIANVLPKRLMINGEIVTEENLTWDDYYAQGWREFVPAKIPEGYRVVSREFFVEEEDGIVYEEVETEPFPPEVPEKITRRQFKMALVLKGISLEAVETALNNIEDPLKRQLSLIEWEDALTFERDHILIGSLAPHFGLTEDDLDDLFIQGGNI